LSTTGYTNTSNGFRGKYRDYNRGSFIRGRWMSVALGSIGLIICTPDQQHIADIPVFTCAWIPKVESICDVYRVKYAKINPMADPNFPVNLDIYPLHLRPSSGSEETEQDIWKQRDAIKQYGIAGRIWYVYTHDES
jgi:hypothetical protein